MVLFVQVALAEPMMRQLLSAPRASARGPKEQFGKGKSKKASKAPDADSEAADEAPLLSCVRWAATNRGAFVLASLVEFGARAPSYAELIAVLKR